MVMRHRILAALVVALWSSTAAAESPRFRIGLDVGLAASAGGGARQDTSGIASLVPAVVLQRGDHWQISVGATIPVAPILHLSLPISVEYLATRRLVLRGSLRPTYARIDLCASGAAACPDDLAAPEDERGGAAAGVFGEAGAGYRWYFANPWSEDARPFEIDLRAGYLAGGWFSRSGDHEQPLGGYWHGFLIGAEMTF